MQPSRDALTRFECKHFWGACAALTLGEFSIPAERSMPHLRYPYLPITACLVCSAKHLCAWWCSGLLSPRRQVGAILKVVLVRQSIHAHTAEIRPGFICIYMYVCVGAAFRPSTSSSLAIQSALSLCSYRLLFSYE